jgi:hypothetical protein
VHVRVAQGDGPRGQIDRRPYFQQAIKMVLL